jgi:hypothetical protein
MYTVAYDDYDNAWLGTADVLSWTVKKLDTNGDSLWQRKYASITYYPTESAADADGNCYFAGPYTAGAVQVVKYMPDGDTAWTSRYSRGGFFDQANAIATGPDGRVVVGGFSSLGFSPSDQDFFVMGLDSGGALAWEKHVDGPDADMDVVNSVDFDPEGNAYATGALTSSGELLVASMKLSPAGDSLWMTTGPEEPAVGARSRESAGATRSTVDGSTGLRGRIITDPFQFIDRTYAVFAQNRDRIGWIFYGALTGVAVTRNFLAGPPLGFTTIAGGGYISRTGAPTFPPASTLQTSVGVHLLSDIGPEERMPESFRLHQNYPNPFNPATVIRYELPVRAMTTLVIYDLLGREVARPVDRVEEPGARSVTWNAGSSPAGIYVYRMTSGAFRQSGKMVLLK